MKVKDRTALVLLILFILTISFMLDLSLRYFAGKKEGEAVFEDPFQVYKTRFKKAEKYRTYPKFDDRLKLLGVKKINNPINKILGDYHIVELETSLAPKEADAIIASKLSEKGWLLKNWKQLGVTGHGCWSFFYKNLNYACIAVFICSSRIDIPVNSSLNKTRIKIISFRPFGGDSDEKVLF